MKKLSNSSIVWLLAILSILLVQFVAAIFIVAFQESQTIITYITMMAIQLLNVLIVFVATKKREYLSCYKIAKVSVKNIVLSVLLGVATIVGMFLIAQYVHEFFVSLGVKASEIDISGGYIILAILSTVILAPIGEELVFRYVLCDALENRSKALAVVLSALAFAFMHMSPMQTVYQFALGCVLALVVIKSGNVVYAMITHATSNLVIIILSLFTLPAIPTNNPLTLVLAIVLFVFALLVVILMFSKMSGSTSDRACVKYEKEEKVTASIVYAIGFAVCLVMWIANFF